MATTDYYEVLGVPRTASAEDIRRAHRRLARQYHPDVNKSPDAGQRFAKIQEAYEVLSDPEKRRRYDQYGHAGLNASAEAAPGGPSYSWSNVGGPHHAADYDEFDVESLFDTFFGARRGRQASGSAQARRPRHSIERDIVVDFLTAARGGSQDIRISTPGGRARSIEVRIPRAVNDGAQLRVARAISEPGADADLLLNVRIEPHPVFRRSATPGGPARGLDLYVDLPLTIAEATLGADVTVPTLSERVEIRVPPATASGRMLRVRGRGLEDESGTKGDLYAVVKIVPPSPADLTEAEKRMLRDIGARGPSPRDDLYRSV